MTGYTTFHCIVLGSGRYISQLPRNTRQVLIGPCKDVPILTEEVDELVFLFFVQPGTDDGSVLRVRLVDLDLLGFLGRLKRGALLRVTHTRHAELS